MLSIYASIYEPLGCRGLQTQMRGRYQTLPHDGLHQKASDFRARMNHFVSVGDLGLGNHMENKMEHEVDNGIMDTI